VNFGREPLSHPLLLEAIETLFVPLAIHNNKPGADARVLKRYEEPAWNNPVIRFFAPDGKELLPRKDRVWSSGAVAGRMLAALNKTDRGTPGYLRLAAEELGAVDVERAVFAMHCFWQGEAALGGQEGVLATRAGWLAGLEIVEVRFDPRRVAYAELVRVAKTFDCTERVFATTEVQLKVARELVGDRAKLNRTLPTDAKASDQKYYLRRSSLNLASLTPLQATRVNAALANHGDAAAFLSPRQLELAAESRREAPESE